MTTDPWNLPSVGAVAAALRFETVYDSTACAAFLSSSPPRDKRLKRKLEDMSNQLARELRSDESLVACVAPLGYGCHGCAFILTDRRLIMIELAVVTSLLRDAIESVSGGPAPWNVGKGAEQVTVVTRSGKTYQGDVGGSNYDVRAFVRSVEDWIDGRQLEQQTERQTERQTVAPVSPPPPPKSAPTVDPGWYPDPTSRFEFRYWDGRVWTHHVSRAGVQSSDSI